MDLRVRILKQKQQVSILSKGNHQAMEFPLHLKLLERRHTQIRKAQHYSLFSQHRQLLIHHKNMSDHFEGIFSQDPEICHEAVETISEKCQEEDSSKAFARILEENAQQFYGQFMAESGMELKLELLINLTSVETPILNMGYLLPIIQMVFSNRLVLEDPKIASNLIWVAANLLLNKVYSQAAAIWVINHQWLPRTYQLLARHPSAKTYVGWFVSACLRKQSIFKAVFIINPEELERACSLANCLLATERNDDGLLHAYRILDQLINFNPNFLKRIGQQQLCSIVYHLEQLDKQHFNIKIYALRILALFIIQSESSLDRFLKSDGLRVIINYLGESNFINSTKLALNILYNCVQVFGWKSDVKFQMASSTFLENSIKILAVNGPYVCADLIHIFVRLVEIQDQGFADYLIETKLVELLNKRLNQRRENTETEAIMLLFRSMLQKTRNKSEILKNTQRVVMEITM